MPFDNANRIQPRALLTLLLCAALYSPAVFADSGSAAGTSSEMRAQASPDSPLKSFLLSAPDTYGWEPIEGKISYDFFPDGRLHIQGPEGEATMWQGTWSLAGNKLTLVNSDERTTEVVVARKEGEELWLDGKRYRRYKPAAE
jgi:hypothetical protein